MTTTPTPTPIACGLILPGTVKGTDIYVAVDTTDPTQSACGSTKNYTIAQLITMILNVSGQTVYTPIITYSTTSLNATYSNGVSGVGATLTNAGTKAALVLNGLTVVANGRYGIFNQSTPAQNGIYIASVVGDSSANWVLTRAIDFNAPSNIINLGVVYVTAGSVNSDTLWQVSFSGSVVVGTTALNWAEFDFLPNLPLSLANGGSGKNLASSASLGGIVYSNTSNMEILGNTTSAFQMLQSGSSAAPSWSSTIWPATSTVNQLLYSSSTNNIVGLATGNGSILTSNSSGVPTWVTGVQGDIIYRNASQWVVLTPGTSGQLLQTGGAAANPSWTSASGTGTVNAGLINQLGWYASSSDVISGLSTANNGVLVTSAGGVPSISSTLPNGLLANSIKIGTIIDNSFGLAVAVFAAAASSVNYISFSGTATGIAPVIAAVGSDTNITLTLTGKGTGSVAIVGTSTNSSAAAGYVGEFITSTVTAASPVSMTASTEKNITTISLTAGDWDVWGNVYITTSSAATAASSAYGWISTTSATIPDLSLVGGVYVASGFLGGAGISAPIIRLSLASTTTVYLSGIMNQAGTITGSGTISARRVR